MHELTKLAKALEVSAKRNGPATPLTIGHLRNIVQMVVKMEDRKKAEVEKAFERLDAENIQP